MATRLPIMALYVIGSCKCIVITVFVHCFERNINLKHFWLYKFTIFVNKHNSWMFRCCVRVILFDLVSRKRVDLIHSPI